MVTLTFILLAAGVLIGVLRGGRISNITRTPLHHGWLVYAGLGIQVAAQSYVAVVDEGLGGSRRGLAILALSYGMLIAFVVLNRRLSGVLLIGCGLALNLIVMVANGGMPVSMRAARRAGFDPGAYLETAVKHRVMTEDTLLAFLGDVIPVVWLRNVVSVGDIVLALGIFVLIQGLMRPNPSERAPADEQTTHDPER